MPIERVVHGIGIFRSKYGGKLVNEQERRIFEQDETKRKIRERYRGVAKDELEFIPAKPKEKLFEDSAQKRVCAYCRVSTDDAKQTSSYELQKNHYEDMIQEHAGWRLVGIYADEGISGTSLQHRDDFIRMMKDCKEGKVDLIVTKSVSRFARNIVDCIAKIRELANQNPPVGVFFETEHIYTLDNTSEMMLAVLSAAAQEESHTKSEIMNISIEQRFSRGIFLTPELLGYDVDDEGNLVVNPEEAETVSLCFYMFLGGYTTSEIAEMLTDLKRKTKRGNTKWSSSSVVGVLQNERHCGDILCRKTFTPNYLNHKAKKNRKDRNQYRQRDHHEAIVDREIFEATQKMLMEFRFRKRGFPLPTLQVIDGGALKGFVPINRSWTGFSGDDYKTASESVYTEQKETINNEILKKNQSGFDLQGYQVVRSQFFSNRQHPSMTLDKGKLTFNTACMKKFLNVEYVELLLNTVENCVAIRPCCIDSSNSIKWGSMKNKRWSVLPKSCVGLSNAMFELMNWNDECKYRFRGYFDTMDDEPVMIFKLSEPEVLIRELQYDAENKEVKDGTVDIDNKDEPSDIKEVASVKIINKLKWRYPKEWVANFGDQFGSSSFVFLERAHYKDNWEVLRPAISVEGCQYFTREMIDILAEKATKMITRMRSAV